MTLEVAESGDENARAGDQNVVMLRETPPSALSGRGGVDFSSPDKPPVAPSTPSPAAAALLAGVSSKPVAQESAEILLLESVHAYLLLSDGWSIPKIEAEGLKYSRWRRDGVDEIGIPLKPAPPPERSVSDVIKAVAALEGRRAEDLATDLRRLRTIQSGPYHDLCEGEKDPNFNKKIASLILRTSTFVVYLDPNDDVFYVMSVDFGERPKDFGKVVNRLSVLLAEPTTHLSPSVRRSFRTLLAEGVARLLHEGSAENALAVFDKAESFLRARNNESARLTYLGAAIPTTLLTIIADVLLWKNRAALDELFTGGFTTAAVAASMGAIGAFLSIFLRLTKVDIDASAGKLLLVVECTLRVFVGVVVAAVVGWAVHADLLLGFTAGIAGGSIGTKMLIGLLSGASERAMPTLMKKFESTMADGPPASDSAAPPKAAQESTKPVVVVVKSTGES